MKLAQLSFSQICKYFWPSWLSPVVLLASSIYESLYVQLPMIINFLILIICVSMLGGPVKLYMNKTLSFEQIALFGYFVPFVIWVVLVFVKIAVFELLIYG